MADTSSITFQSSIHTPNILEQDSIDFELTMLMDKLLTTLQQVKTSSNIDSIMYFKVIGLIQQVLKKFIQFKNQCIETHLSCLQYIQILLYQRDYSQALSKIDEYKKIKLSNLSKDNILNSVLTNKKIQQHTLTLIQQKSIINNKLASFQLKQKIWLKYAMQKLQQQQQLSHVTLSQIQHQQHQQIIRQLNEEIQPTTSVKQIINQMLTPDKKILKSTTLLINQNNKQKTKTFLKSRKTSSKQKLQKPIATQKVSTQKRTIKKKLSKYNQQNQTNKKSIISFFS